jgi:hypothetical protein
LSEYHVAFPATASQQQKCDARTASSKAAECLAHRM